MAVNGITFENRIVKPANDAILYNAIVGGDCILNGCDIALSGTSATIQTGQMLIAGRVIEIDSPLSVEIDNIPATGYVQIYMLLDTSASNTPTQFAQGTIQQTVAATDIFNALPADDINASAVGQYGAELFVLEVAGGQLSSVTRRLRTVEKNIMYWQGHLITALWRGSWPSGTTINIPGVSAYHMLLADTEGSSTRLALYRESERFRGGNVWSASNGTTYIETFAFTYDSNDNATYAKYLSRTINSSNAISTGYADLPILSIYGVI